MSKSNGNPYLLVHLTSAVLNEVMIIDQVCNDAK